MSILVTPDFGANNFIVLFLLIAWVVVLAAAGVGFILRARLRERGSTKIGWLLGVPRIDEPNPNRSANADATTPDASYDLQLLDPRPSWCILAGLFLIFDVIICGNCLITLVFGPIWFLQVLSGTSRHCAGWRASARWMIVPVLTIAVVLGNAYLQSIVASTNARRIVNACRQYAAANGKYPDDLGSLVPQYLKSIPPAKYCIGESRNFTYHSSVGIHLLVGGVFPGKWSMYNLESYGVPANLEDQ